MPFLESKLTMLLKVSEGGAPRAAVGERATASRKLEKRFSKNREASNRGLEFDLRVGESSRINTGGEGGGAS